ncbi:hypothetical protein [Stenotrophomonas geniculata]|uniref:hypothetical protein n=1 Tax=Stenotrophomonas geniculata TaxID=86188 RepID=UPI00370D21D8
MSNATAIFKLSHVGPKSAASKTPIDFLFRVQSTPAGLSVSGATMAVFKQPFYALVKDCRALARTVDAMRQTIEYHTEYINLLMDEAGDDEFEQLEIQFAHDMQEASASEIVNYVAAIQRWVPSWQVNASDVADVLRIDVDCVQNAVDNFDYYASKEPQWLKMESGSTP